MIDAHVHVWTLEPERYPWRQTLAHVPIPTEAATAEDLLGKMDAAGVSHAVLVQPSVYGWDNSYLCDCLERYPDRIVGMCLVDWHAPDAAACLRYWCRERGCRGLRVNVIADEDAGWILEAARDDLWQTAVELAVPVAFQMRPEQALQIDSLAARYPELTVVVDYLGPGVFGERDDWSQLARLAQRPNAFIKLLSVAQDSQEPYPFRDLWPFYEFMTSTFDPNRTMFGTDYPHVQIGCSYEQAIDWLQVLPFLSDQVRHAIGEETARHLWHFERK